MSGESTEGDQGKAEFLAHEVDVDMTIMANARRMGLDLSTTRLRDEREVMAQAESQSSEFRQQVASKLIQELDTYRESPEGYLVTDAISVDSYKEHQRHKAIEGFNVCAELLGVPSRVGDKNLSAVEAGLDEGEGTKELFADIPGTDLRLVLDVISERDRDQDATAYHLDLMRQDPSGERGIDLEAAQEGK